MKNSMAIALLRQKKNSFVSYGLKQEEVKWAFSWKKLFSLLYAVFCNKQKLNLVRPENSVPKQSLADLIPNDFITFVVLYALILP